MIRRLRLGRTYFAGDGGVHVVRHDGTAYDRAAGYPLIFDTWPAQVTGQVIDSHGRIVAVVQDQMRRVAEDKVLA